MLYTIIFTPNGPESLKEAAELLKGRYLRANIPQWQVDFARRDEANLALVNLKNIPGIQGARISPE